MTQCYSWSEGCSSSSLGEDPGLRGLEQGGRKVGLERCTWREGKWHFMKGSCVKGKLTESISSDELQGLTCDFSFLTYFTSFIMFLDFFPLCFKWWFFSHHG